MPKFTASLRKRCCIASVIASLVSAIAAPVSADSKKLMFRMEKGMSLGQYYTRVQDSLVNAGLLRQDLTLKDAPSTPHRLARDFAEIALRSEYGGSLGASGSGSRKPVMRWEVPVRMNVVFGASVPPEQRMKDSRAIGAYMKKLSRITGHPVTQTNKGSNFHVLVVNDAERKSLATTLRKMVPNLGSSSIRAVERMKPNHFCMVIASPYPDRKNGYQSVVAIVRAEHPDMMRTACIQEELAQGMGLPNDCNYARPSIFNDDQEFGLLTKHDERLLQMLYHPALTSGMPRKQAEPLLKQIAAQVVARG
ncbi:MAG: DUF2927 domain-containing protein [Pseudomonadota bacterium]